MYLMSCVCLVRRAHTDSERLTVRTHWLELDWLRRDGPD